MYFGFIHSTKFYFFIHNIDHLVSKMRQKVTAHFIKITLLPNTSEKNDGLSGNLSGSYQLERV